MSLGGLLEKALGALCFRNSNATVLGAYGESTFGTAVLVAHLTARKARSRSRWRGKLLHSHTRFLFLDVLQGKLRTACVASRHDRALTSMYSHKEKEPSLVLANVPILSSAASINGPPT